MKRLYLFAAALGLALSSGAMHAIAQEEHLKELPGYVEFDDLREIYGEPKVMINIGGALLKLVQNAADADDDPDAEILKGLDGVRINVYSTNGERSAALDQVNEMKNLLQRANWEPFVQVNEEEETVYMFMKADGTGVQGMAIMVVNNEEAVFMNIIGNIDPEQVGNVVNGLDVDVPVE